jgi:polyisoprenyl-phosphate glycosyltransferase
MVIKPDISLIFPLYNEAENLSFLIPQLNSFFSGYPGIKAEVIFVDDGSSDNSVEIIREGKHEFYAAKIIKLARNSGSHAAVRAGIYHSTGNRISILAADLQDPLQLVIEMYEECQKGADIVIAQRRTVNAGYFTRLFSMYYAHLMRKYAIKDFPKKGADVVMFNSKVSEVLNNNIEANSNFVLQIFSLGFRKTFIEYDKTARKYGKSKWTLSKKIKLLIDSFVAFSFFPIRMVSVAGILMFLIGLLWTCYIVTRTLLYHDLAQGWPTMVSILMLGFGLTNISLGIVAEYLWRTLDTSRKRPVFIIDEIIEVNR